MFENANVPQKYRYMFGGFDEHNVLVDCGGNVGLITDIGLFLGMEIYTFEPSKAAFKLLKKKYDGNNRVHLYEKAVSDENTTLLFYSNVQELYDQ
jgi:FkbM family methyltransferase